MLLWCALLCHNIFSGWPIVSAGKIWIFVAWINDFVWVFVRVADATWVLHEINKLISQPVQKKVPLFGRLFAHTAREYLNSTAHKGGQTLHNVLLDNRIRMIKAPLSFKWRHSSWSWFWGTFLSCFVWPQLSTSRLSHCLLKKHFEGHYNHTWTKINISPAFISRSLDYRLERSISKGKRLAKKNFYFKYYPWFWYIVCLHLHHPLNFALFSRTYRCVKSAAFVRIRCARLAISILKEIQTLHKYQFWQRPRGYLSVCYAALYWSVWIQRIQNKLAIVVSELMACQHDHIFTVWYARLVL